MVEVITVDPQLGLPTTETMYAFRPMLALPLAHAYIPAIRCQCHAHQHHFLHNDIHNNVRNDAHNNVHDDNSGWPSRTCRPATSHHR